MSVVRSPSAREVVSQPAPGRPARERLAALVALLLTVLAWWPSLSLAATPRGPSFGRTRYRTEIRHGAREDVDDYVSALLPGEALSVRVSARGAAGSGGSPLRPIVEVYDPGGADRTPASATVGDGRTVAFRRLRIDRPGPWTVRVRGEGSSEGEYEARFSVSRPPPLRFSGQRVGGGAPLEREHAFEAVGGASLRATLRAGRGGVAPSLLAVTDSAGDAVAVGAPRGGRRSRTWPAIRLAGADGRWTATVGVEEGSASYSLGLRVLPPPRPRGTIRLHPSEPRLPFLARPLEGSAAHTVTLTGGGFSVDPRPDVWFGGRRAVVAEGTAHTLRVLPPEAPDGSVVEVAVVNPDGQAAVREGHFAYALPVPPRVASIEPASISLYVGGAREFVVRLTRPAGYPGADVTLSTTGGIGEVEPAVTIAGSVVSARVRFTASDAAAEGTVVAALGGVAVTSRVVVVPLPPGPDPPPLPDEIDLSGWTLRQGNSARTFTFPAGTKLVAPATVVVGRAATKAAFAGYWDVSFGDDVTYLTADPTNTSSTSDDWPSINGSESYELRDAAGKLVDGPTLAMGEFGGQNLQRTPGTDPGAAESWTVHEFPYSWATPGRVPAGDGVEHGVWISEFSDVLGSGNYAFEFVELHFDGLPDPP